MFTKASVQRPPSNTVCRSAILRRLVKGKTERVILNLKAQKLLYWT